MTDSITVFLNGVMLFLVKLVVVWSGGNIATRDSSSHSKVHRRCSLVIAGPVLAWFCYSFITRSKLINYRAREIKLNLNYSASILTYFSPRLNQISIVHLYSRVTPCPPRYLQGRAAMLRMAEQSTRGVESAWPGQTWATHALTRGVTRPLIGTTELYSIKMSRMQSLSYKLLLISDAQMPVDQIPRP